MNESAVEIISSLDTQRFEVQRRLQLKIGGKLDYLCEKLFELADGVWIFYKAPDGSVVKAYKRPPDAKAITYLLDRVAGKPTQQVEAHTQSTGIISVQHIFKQLVDDNAKRIAQSRVGSPDGLEDVPQ